MSKRSRRKSSRPPTKKETGESGDKPLAPMEFQERDKAPSHHAKVEPLPRKPTPKPGNPLGPLQYKVIELSTVDEASLEQIVNTWVGRGWNLDGVQFAMRESSKRPSMAFVFFTRQDVETIAHDPGAAREKLRRMADEEDAKVLSLLEDTVRDEPAERFSFVEERTWTRSPPDLPADPKKRLERLADLDDDEDEP